MEYKQENVRTGDYYFSYKRREGEKESFRFSVANVYDEEEEEKKDLTQYILEEVYDEMHS